VTVDLPVSVLGMVGLVTVTQALIRLTDELSTFVMGNFEDNIADFTAVVTSLSTLAGGGATALVVVLLGLVTVLAGLILVTELAVRAALIYIVVALAPLVFAVRLWPSLEGVAKRTLQLLVALILSKLAMAVALAVAASSAVGAGSGGEVAALPPPEVFVEDPGSSVTQAVGILLAAVAAFGVAAFSPLLVSRLLPLAEAAVVAQGIRGMPVRGGTQAASMAYYTQGLTGMRLQRLAQGGGSLATSTSPAGPLGPPTPGTTAPPPGPGSPGGGWPPSSPGSGRGGSGAPPAGWRPVPNQPDPALSPGGVGAVARTAGAPGAATAGTGPAGAAAAGTGAAGTGAAGVAAGAIGPAGPAVAGAAVAGRVAASSLRAAVASAQRAQRDVGDGGSAGGGSAGGGRGG
jgi:hypothetical protein